MSDWILYPLVLLGTLVVAFGMLALWGYAIGAALSGSALHHKEKGNDKMRY